jgi:hypothetical protein
MQTAGVENQNFPWCQARQAAVTNDMYPTNRTVLMARGSAAGGVAVDGDAVS